MKKRLLFIIAVFITWLLVFAIQKPVFMIYHHSPGNMVSPADYFQVMLHGLKLDGTVAGYLSVFPLLAVLLSIWINIPWMKKVLKGYFLVTALFVSLIFSIDVALYGYWGFRLDATLLFYLESPADAMASVPVGSFLFQTLFFVLYTWGIYYLFKRWIIPLFPEQIPRKRIASTASLLLIGGILFIFIRGGVTTSTANVGMVYFSRNQFLNHAAINPCFSFLTSLMKQQNFSEQFNFFPENERKEIIDSLLPDPENGTTTRKILNIQRPNILLILLESFSASAIEVLGGEKGVTPSLNELSREGILFTQMYANSFRTDRGIVSVLNGYPAQPTTSIMKYPAKSQTLPSIAESLVKEGYQADMLYGGDINFTNMQSYFYSSGYSHITSDRNFPLSTRLNKWGANDDITFQHLFETIRERDNAEPWFTTFLTLSSHEPFDVPFHRWENPYINSIAFTDSCLGIFIEKFKTLPAWENTLVILVSDHGYRYPAATKEYEPARYHIPMLWLGGAIEQPEIVSLYTSQNDLSATLLNQLDISTCVFNFSKDIFSTQPFNPYIFYTFNNGFGFIDDSGLSVYDNESNQILSVENTPGNEERIQKGKALLQTLYNDLGSR